MKESITKFDLEAAFKALDAIDIPIAEKGISANKPALTEIFSRKSKFDALMEEYYDIGSTEDLSDAKEAMDAEVAKAKLARIEKIVDLDAESPDDLLTSYVGKLIIQCPQCMTLFYKNPEDVEESEEDAETVNVNEVCQHCGNESGYTLIGKVGEAAPEEFAEVPAESEVAEEENLDLDTSVDEETADMEEGSDDLDISLDALDLEEPVEEEDKKEESFMTHEGKVLNEDIADEAELDAKLEAHSEYIEYLRNMITQEEEALEKTKNEQVKAAIQRRIDSFKEDLEEALPEAVKNEDILSDEILDETEETLEKQEESYSENSEEKALTESLHEEAENELDVSAEDFEKLIKSSEFKTPISDQDTRKMMQEFEEPEKEVEEELTENLEESEATLEEGIFDKIKDKVSSWVDERKLKSRAEKADFILTHAMEDYDNLKVDKAGKLIPDEKNQRFHTFVIIGFKENYSNGKLITMAPSFSNKDLVVGMKRPETKKTYKEADNIAKGWSMRQGNGPAFIYLAKSPDDEKAVFLCEYFKGELDYDQLEKYFEVVKKDLKAAELMAKGGMNQSEDDTPGDDKPKGKHEAPDVETQGEPDEGKTESLNTLMTSLENLNEATLEASILTHLQEQQSDIEQFKLTDCHYLEEKLLIEGEVLTKAGETSKTSYSFTEMIKEDQGRITFKGLNEAVETEGPVAFSGHVEKSTKTFFTESFTNII